MKKESNYIIAFIAIIGIALCIFTLAIISNSISLLDLFLTLFVCVGVYTAFELIIKKR
jgi:hypothetical protein